jgi:ribosomal-protein-alanine N-acetyltransferase
MCERDIASTVAGLGDFEVSRHLARVPYPYTEEDARRWFEETRRGRLGGASEHFTIVLRSKDQPLGAIGWHADATLRRAEIGYWIARPSWGNGYAREALAAVVQHAFFTRTPALDILEAKVHETNPASMRVLEACGFLDVGAVACASLATGTTVPARQFELRAERCC